MPALGVNTLSKTHFDSSLDNPRLARAELEALFDYVYALALEIPAGSRLFHTNFDGAGSGLDAATLGGQNATYFRDLDNAIGTVDQGQVSGLVSALNNKANITHNHDAYYLRLSELTQGYNIVSRYFYFGIGNLLFQAAGYTSTVDGDETFSFPISFTDCLGVVTSRNVSGAGVSVAAYDWTASQFTVNRDNGLDGGQPFSMIAFGTNL